MSIFANLQTLTDGQRFLIDPVRLHSDLIIQNLGSTNVYLGDSTVSSTNYGLKLVPNMGITLSLAQDDQIYAVTSGANSSISILNVGGRD